MSPKLLFPLLLPIVAAAKKPTAADLQEIPAGPTTRLARCAAIFLHNSQRNYFCRQPSRIVRPRLCERVWKPNPRCAVKPGNRFSLEIQP